MNIYEVQLRQSADDAREVWLTATGVATTAMSAGQLVLDIEQGPNPAFELEVRSVRLIAECEFIEK